MEKIIKEIEARIKAMKCDPYIDNTKRVTIINENRRILKMIRRLTNAETESLKPNPPELDREWDTGRIGIGDYEYED